MCEKAVSVIRSFQWCLLLRVMFVCALLILGHAGCGGGERAGVAGKDALKDVFLVENDTQTLKLWSARKVQVDVLVHIDTSDGMRMFAASSEQDLRNAGEHLKRGNTAIVDQLAPSLKGGGFVNLGFRAEFFKRVVWVIPSNQPATSQPIEVFKTFLMTRRGFPESVLKDLRPSGSHIVGTLTGLPITITRLEDMEIGEGESIILDIDLAYFVGLRAQDPSYQTGTRSLLKFAEALRGKGLHTRMVTINLCTQSGLCPMDIRFFGRVMRDAFTKPSYLREPVFEKWSKMMVAEDSLVALRYEPAIAVYEELVEKYTRDPGLWFALAVARGFAERGIESRQALLEAYALDGAYLNGFFQLARVLAVGDKIEAGTAVLETPDLTKVIPAVEMDFQRGVFYLNAKRPYDAITYFNRVAQIRPKDFALQTAIYRAHKLAENEQGMLTTLEKLRRMDEDRVRRDMPWVYKELGRMYEEATLYKNAMEVYQEYLRLVPGDTSAPDIEKKVAEWKSYYE
ncbi:MAG: tetratricopeptide repeat protein [bacterium]|nr:MAG: tetratricopeptide repeat protein [bacterium]